MIEKGDPAPQFALTDDRGSAVTLASFAGAPFVLYFYPKDDTSGCTAEAKDFSRLAEAFADLGVAVLGVSPDGQKSHEKFKAKYDLAVRLASDSEDKAAARAYGVWVEKSMYGRTYMGIERTTFLIGADGRIARIWRKVKVAGHADEVLAAARTLAAETAGAQQG